jgi:metallo-beta-lactamase family protein
MKIQFLGATRQVTGSCYRLEVGGKNIMIDCGMFQEREFKKRNWAEPVFPPSKIDAVLITHAHLDHCGLLPRLVSQGFRGKIYTTEASAELISIVLHDSAKIQMEDVKYKKKRHLKEGRKGPFEPEALYTEEDVIQTLPLIQDVAYGEPIRPIPELQAVFREAGHILGSALLDLTTGEGDAKRRIVFSGDLGQIDRPIVRDPAIITQADYLVMESTYGDREHGANGRTDTSKQMAKLINETYEAGGNIVIPTFAIERAQELIYQIGQLIHTKKIPSMPVFLDSPMANRVTHVFRRHRELFDEDAWKRINAGETPFQFPELQLIQTPDESKAINDVKGPCIIMSTSGMCTAGRIKHHLTHNIKRKESLILFVGYQAAGTLGRQILEGRKEVRIFGRTWPVRAKIAQVHGFSGHADKQMLVSWLSNIKSPPRRVFLTHGDERAALALADDLRDRFGWTIDVPSYRNSIQLGE